MALILPVSKAPAAPQAESSHWYYRDGRTCYQQPTQKGGLRATDLRDARKLGLVPSVTTVLSVLAKPALETWKVKQGILAALTLPRRSNESDDEYLARVLADSGQQAKDAAEEGTRIHDAIEASFKGMPIPAGYEAHVEGARAEIGKLFPEVSDWIAEKSFGHIFGYGGKVDLHSPSTGIVVDYKGKDGDFTDGKRLAYDQHYQLAAYQRGLILPPNVCANVFVSRTHPGKVASHVWKLAEVQQGWAVFEAALTVWKRLKGFDPSFSAEERAA
jgi:hypothetical protein